ncbi:hypothetical protein ElyMa_003066000 [Elysia marginata]|uniref:Uncharacterized protein n=1 Tax=Elysia marginata TaxID=1093978 RepID=A0AAV4IER5_9GAST|nr:hypothetical protein ElyMa_003066000 [Elysia marginata]
MLVRVSGSRLVRLSGNKPDPLAISFRLERTRPLLLATRGRFQQLWRVQLLDGANQKVSVSRTNQNPITISPPG